MPNTTTVIVGAGHCGLAMSHCLAARSIDHVVLERGQVANSWRTQRWDSLRLLTPNWMTRLPGYAYRGADPDGYLSARQVAAMLADYAGASAAPVLTGVTVTSVRAAAGGYVLQVMPGAEPGTIDRLEQNVAALDHPPGNIAVSGSGRFCPVMFGPL